MPILVLQSGFTLIEIIIVISLISLLLFFSFPSLSGLRCTILGKVVAQKISTAVRLARIEALTRGATTRIKFDPVNNTFTYRDSMGHSTLYEIPEGVVLYRANFLENNILYFYPTGTPSSGGTITLRVKDRLKYVIITPVTGRVRISDTL